jgi:hypothetical protein
MRDRTPIRGLVAITIILVALSAVTALNATQYVPIVTSAMKGVRGSLPGCNGNWTYRPCSENSDSAKSCWGADGQQNNCDANKACEGCDAVEQNQWCSGDRPWNALCDPRQNGTADKGCGKDFTGAKCSWSGTDRTCRCAGQQGASNCRRATAVNTGLAPNGCNLQPVP